MHTNCILVDMKPIIYDDIACISRKSVHRLDNDTSDHAVKLFVLLTLDDNMKNSLFTSEFVKSLDPSINIYKELLQDMIKRQHPVQDNNRETTRHNSPKKEDTLSLLKVTSMQ